MEKRNEIFIPDLFIYDLLKFESPEILTKLQGIYISAQSLVRFVFRWIPYFNGGNEDKMVAIIETVVVAQLKEWLFQAPEIWGRIQSLTNFTVWND